MQLQLNYHSNQKTMPACFSKPIRASTDDEFTADAASPYIGIQQRGKRDYTIEKGGTKRWFMVPPEFGGGKRNVIGNNVQMCCCKQHMTDVHWLHGEVFVYHCTTRDTFVWRAK